MAEYIEKQAVIGEILGQPPEAHYPAWYAEQVKAIPPADVRPVVRGRWKRTRLGWYCTNCELYPPFPLDYDPEEKGVPYCQWCGADMRGGNAE